MTHVLVINSGSSSIKFQVLDPDAGAEAAPLVVGIVERIGEETGAVRATINGQDAEVEGRIEDHADGLRRAFDLLADNDASLEKLGVVAVGHRLVHGGQDFSEPVIITDEVLDAARDNIPLAPLHNPANIKGVEVLREALPDVPQVGVFDTAFFHELPAAARTYAIDRDVAEEHSIRRYGFHGTSHEFVAGRVADHLGKRVEDLNQIIFHLGNGASASAIKGGRPVDTTMGLTPLEGLVMGTRSGSLDPGIVFHLARNADLSIDDIDQLLNKKSGLKGLAGANDFRQLGELIDKGDENAKLAFDVYIHQLRRTLGSYLVVLGGADTITFTAGVGENVAAVREAALDGLEGFGIVLDKEKNKNAKGPAVISAEDSKVTVLVVPTNEELAIARHAARFSAQQ
ncbi:acetate/propionate family kinase [Corynebacterium otitidis]|uniref:Acetate kinase n=1 Tax=Corynebacterium otitidis ATCC 51513 TaxID=883169 RepID=I7L9I9_9CORY|nr:acetate kinase [Corynebacterium otitidis]EJZ81651.1 acetate kinase [Corynebacterium otitidis ATCC 51513]CCI83847.1 acetate kinase [Corynebacterium otitidis ATCC 51513]